MKLLIVDDEIFAIQGILNGVNWESLDYGEISQACSYAQAVEDMEKAPADVVLCDIEMPDESGLELVAWVNEHYPQTVCLILSCHDEFDFARQAVSLKCFDYILKPTRYDFLTEVLRKAGIEAAERKHLTVMENYGKLYIDNISAGKKKDNVDVAAQTASYIDSHLSEDLSVKLLASMVYVSPDHLTRVFKKRFHQTVMDYILGKRMELAGELLKDPGLTITMVSDCAGFNNYSYFTEQFKKHYGMLPREYQAKNKAKP